MISQANIKWISQVGGVPVEDISGALSNEEEVSLDLRIPGRIISQEDEKTLKETAVQQGKEIGFKEIAKESSIELASGEKDAKIIAAKIKGDVTTSLEDKYKNPQPGEKEKELEKSLSASELKYDKLLETHEGLQGQIEEKDKLYTGLQSKIKIKERNNAILKAFPDKMKMDRNDALLITSSTFTFEENEGILSIKKGDELMTDDVGKPETLENVVISFVEEKKWLNGSGMNGKDRPGQNGAKKGGKTHEEAHKFITEKLGADKAASPEGLKLFKELTAVE
jgi:hypothetical protein